MKKFIQVLPVAIALLLISSPLLPLVALLMVTSPWPLASQSVPLPLVAPSVRVVLLLLLSTASPATPTRAASSSPP